MAALRASLPVKTKKTEKHHTFSSTAGERPTIPTVYLVIEEVRAIFALPNFFDPISSYAARGY